MDGTTFAWALAGTISAGIQLFYQKVVAHERRDAAVNGFFTYAISGIFALIVFLLAEEVPAMWLPIAFFGFLSGLIHGLGNFIRIEALKYIDAVLYFPINKVLGPVLVVIAGVLIFGDALSGRDYVGVALSLCVPLLLISAVEHMRQTNIRKGLSFLIFSTGLTAISILFVKQGLSYGTNIVFMLMLAQLAGTASQAMILWKNRIPFSALFEKRNFRLGLIAGVLGFTSTFTLFMALKSGFVSLVYVIHAHYILIPIILSVWLYKEHINARKVLAIVASSLALILLYEA